MFWRFAGRLDGFQMVTDFRNESLAETWSLSVRQNRDGKWICHTLSKWSSQSVCLLALLLVRHLTKNSSFITQNQLWLSKPTSENTNKFIANVIGQGDVPAKASLCLSWITKEAIC